MLFFVSLRLTCPKITASRENRPNEQQPVTRPRMPSTSEVTAAPDVGR
jgi:hypothetical protein